MTPLQSVPGHEADHDHDNDDDIDDDTPELSVVIPVYNEEQGLAALFERLYPALDALGVSYELIFINDGSRDRSAALLAAQFERRPDVTRVILFNGNFGQHRAILAGFEHCRGERTEGLALLDVGVDPVAHFRPPRIGKNRARSQGTRPKFHSSLAPADEMIFGE